MKRIILGGLLVLFVILSTFLLTACDDFLGSTEQPHEHRLGEWETVREPDCETYGIIRRECLDCDYSEEDKTDPKGHTFSEWIIDSEATCNEAGSKHIECTVCGDLISTQIISAIGEHIPGEWILDKQANCIEEGLAHTECIACGALISEKVIPATGKHKYENDKCVVCGVTSDNCFEFYYSVETQSYEISAKPNYKLPDEVILPNKYNKKPVTSIRSDGFALCENITSVVIPDSVTNIGDFAFYKCKNLTNVKIGDGVMNIGYNAFAFCISLTSVGIPNNVRIINDYAFYYCSSISSISIGEQVANLGSYAFLYCDSLTKIVVEEGNPYYKSIDGNVYSKDGEIFIQYAIGKQDAIFEIPNGVKVIGDSSFLDCKNLVNVIIPSSVTTIGYEAFSLCVNITDVIIPDSVETIGDYAFAYCTNIVNVKIGDGVTEIGYSAFAECEKLSNVELGGNVSVIGAGSFAECESLTFIKISDSVETINEYAFFGCISLIDIIVENNQNYQAIDGNLYSKDGKKFVLYAPGKKENTFEIPYGVEDICLSAFAGCKSLVKVVIPDSIVNISSYAFEGCENLADVSIPDVAVFIDLFAFYGTAYYNDESNWIDGILYLGNHLIENDKTISGECVIREGTVTIAKEAFSNSSITSVVIPDSVVYIGCAAFVSCREITHIVIPESVEFIGDYAFDTCFNLVTVEFKDTKGWNTISSENEDVTVLLSSEDLSDFETAAMYLTNTYSYYHWRKD